MTWPRWDRGSVGALAAYVLPDECGMYGTFPGKSARAQPERLQAIYDELLSLAITYDHEPVGGGPGRQPIRRPDEVLGPNGPQATCIDLCLVAAGLCLRAGLHPLILVTADHALLAVWLGESHDPDEVNWDGGPAPAFPLATPVGQLGPIHDAGVRPAIEAEGAFVVLDVAGTAEGYPDGHFATLDDAIAAGASHVLDGAAADQVRVCDVGSIWSRDDALDPGVAAWDARQPVFSELFRDPGPEVPVIQLPRAQFQMVPFQASDEYLVLTERCRSATAEGGPVIEVVHGAGGVGKTRLALEVAAQLRLDGWTAGLIGRGELTDLELGRLAAASGPVFLAIDYADAYATDLLAKVVATLGRSRRRGPLVILLLARTAGPWWELLRAALAETLTTRPHVFDELPSVAARSHQSLWRHAVTRFAHRARGEEVPDLVIPPIPPQPPKQRWTTLDLVLHAWLGAYHPGEPPATREALYDEILRHEWNYWRTRAGTSVVERDEWAGYAARLSATTPQSRTECQAVCPEIERPHLDAFIHVWAGGTTTDGRFPEGLALRPDAIGDHLVRSTFVGDRTAFAALVAACVAFDREHAVEGQETLSERLLANLSRAETDSDAAADAVATLLVALVEQQPDRWGVFVESAILGSHAAASALRAALEQSDPESPEGQLIARTLASVIPLAHSTLRDLAADAARRVSGEPSEGEERAASLMVLAVRLSETGLHLDALAPAREALDVYRALAQEDPEGYLPALSTALGNIGALLLHAGQRAEALAITEEAVAIGRVLVEQDPATYEVRLAGALNNLGAILAVAGRREEALARTEEAVALFRTGTGDDAVTQAAELAGALSNLGSRLTEAGRGEDALGPSLEAVAIYRKLVAVRPAEYLASLAMALGNHGNHLSDAGHREEALAPSLEALAIRRQLAAANPAAFLSELAGSLTNLSGRLDEAGRRDEALVVAEEAVAIRRDLVASNPSAYLPRLAGDLSNLGSRLAGVGRRDEALGPTQESVQLLRQLAEEDWAAFAPNLATALNNLANRFSEAGRREDALEPSFEAVAIRRELVASNRMAFLPSLAMVLSNLGGRLAEAGRHHEAMAPTEEAVAIRRELVALNRAAFLPSLASSLNSLGARLAEAGRPVEALALAEEAVTIRRELVASNRDAHLPNLAGSLVNLSSRLSAAGRRDEATAVVEEGVVLYRELVAGNRAAYLPGLAGALTGHGVRLAEAGRIDDAEAPTEEAVALYRELVQSAPQAYLPRLAGALSNMGNRLAEAGEDDEAVAPSAEAVEIYQRLAEESPAAFLPDLAMALNNYGNRLSSSERADEALAPAAEAVEIYRTLVEVNPALHLPRLAGALSNLGNRLSEADDDDAAAVASAESVEIYRQLAEQFSGAVLPDLAMAVGNYGGQLWTVGRTEEALELMAEAVDRFAALAAVSPTRFLELLSKALINEGRRLEDVGRGSERADRVRSVIEPFDAGSRALVLAVVAGTDGGAEQQALLVEAAAIADGAGDVMAGEARRVIRASFREKAPSGVPDWASRPLAEAQFTAANAWVATSTWPEREAWLQEHLADGVLTADDVGAFRALFPEADEPLGDLEELLRTAADDPDAHRTDLERRRRTWVLWEEVHAWFETETWGASKQFLAEHPNLRTQVARAFLQGLGESGRRVEDVALHGALLDLLADGAHVDDVFDWIVDEQQALSAALVAIDEGRLPFLRDLFLISQVVMAVPHGALVALVLAPSMAEPEEYADLVDSIRDVYATGPVMARTAAIVHLRRFTSAAGPDDADAVGLATSMIEVLEAVGEDGADDEEPEPEPA